MTLMKVSTLAKLENKEHNLAAAFLTLGSASGLLGCFKKNLISDLQCSQSGDSDRTYHSHLSEGVIPEPHPRPAEREFWG